MLCAAPCAQNRLLPFSKHSSASLPQQYVGAAPAFVGPASAAAPPPLIWLLHSMVLANSCAQPPLPCPTCRMHIPPFFAQSSHQPEGLEENKGMNESLHSSNKQLLIHHPNQPARSNKKTAHAQARMRVNSNASRGVICMLPNRRQQAAMAPPLACQAAIGAQHKHTMRS